MPSRSQDGDHKGEASSLGKGPAKDWERDWAFQFESPREYNTNLTKVSLGNRRWFVGVFAHLHVQAQAWAPRAGLGPAMQPQAELPGNKD